MKKRFLSLLVCMMLVISIIVPTTAYAATTDPRITIANKEFRVDGKKIWINGANTPWNNWNDFGGNFDATWWDNHFKELRNAGINATRVWINCNGDGSISINSSGTVSGASKKHWDDLDSFFSIAQKNEIYIMATLISFDHLKSANTNYQYWRSMISSSEKIDSFVNNYTIPFVTKYGDNPYLWSIDIVNEPDWIYEDSSCGNISWNNISNFIARNAAAIHKNSKVLVTVGMASIKYNADGAGYEGNKISDTFLKGIFNDSAAYVDFYSPHYYDWVGEWYGVPFYVTPTGSKPNGWGLDNTKPAVIGECPASGTSGNTITKDYQNAYNNGWQGAMGWTTNGVDGCGSLVDLSPATKQMSSQYPSLVFPAYITLNITTNADYSNVYVTSLISSNAETQLFNINSDGSLTTLNLHWSQFNKDFSAKAARNEATQITFTIYGNSGTNYWVELGQATLDLTKAVNGVLNANLKYSSSSGYYFVY